MPLLAALLGLHRKSLIITAFVALMVAGAVVSLGAWTLLRREGRRHAPDRSRDETTSI